MTTALSSSTPHTQLAQMCFRWPHYAFSFFFPIKWAIWIFCFYLGVLLMVKATRQLPLPGLWGPFLLWLFPKYNSFWLVYLKSLYVLEWTYEAQSFSLNSVVSDWISCLCLSLVSYFNYNYSMEVSLEPETHLLYDFIEMFTISSELKLCDLGQYSAHPGCVRSVSCCAQIDPVTRWQTVNNGWFPVQTLCL